MTGSLSPKILLAYCMIYDSWYIAAREVTSDTVVSDIRTRQFVISLNKFEEYCSDIDCDFVRNAYI